MVVCTRGDQRPGRQEPGGAERRRHRHGVGGQRWRPGGRAAFRSDRPRDRYRRRSDQGLRRLRGRPTAAISAFYNAGAVPAPIMAGFSSRGPKQGDANMLKPDLTAPGVDVIATVTAALTEAQRDAVANGTLVPPPAWSSYQGTSMSSPHVAGLAALLKQAHPTWSPAAIKSALMTTTSPTLNDGLAGPSRTACCRGRRARVTSCPIGRSIRAWSTTTAGSISSAISAR